MRIPLFGKKTQTAVDPVCGMDVDMNDPSGGTWDYQNQIYYFCGSGCNRAFQKEPEAYMSGEKKFEM